MPSCSNEEIEGISPLGLKEAHPSHDAVSKRLRRWTRNPLGSACREFKSPRCRFAIAAAVAAAVGAAANMGNRFCSTAAMAKANYASQHQESECHYNFTMPSRCSIPHWPPSPIGGSVRLIGIQDVVQAIVGPFSAKGCVRVKGFASAGSGNLAR